MLLKKGYRTYRWSFLLDRATPHRAVKASRLFALTLSGGPSVVYIFQHSEAARLEIHSVGHKLAKVNL